MSELQQSVSDTSNGQPSGEDNQNTDNLSNGETDLATVNQEQAQQQQQQEPKVEPTESEKAQQAINKQHYKFREQQRRADELEKKVKELEAKTATQSHEQEAEVPSLPQDPWADDYSAQIQRREAVIANNAQIAARREFSQQNAALEQQRAQQLEQDRVQQLSNGFEQNAKKLNVDLKALDEAQGKIIQYGVSPDLATALLSDDQGPVLVQYLAANPLQLNEIANASPLAAGMMLADIKSRASTTQQNISNAPPPPTSVNGTAVPTKERGPKGATFE